MGFESGIPGNTATDDPAKEALIIPHLIAWIKQKHEQEQQEKWENSTKTMKECKPHHIMNTNTKTMTISHKPLTHWIYQSHPFCSDGQRSPPGMPLMRSKSHHRPHSMAF
jgi:hypothetical protein